MSIDVGLFNYWVVAILMVSGLYTVISRGHLIKKIIGLNIFQVSVFMMYITMGKVQGGYGADLLRGSERLLEPAQLGADPDRHCGRRRNHRRRFGARGADPRGLRHARRD